MVKLSDLPIKHDDSMECTECGVACLQNRTIYKDAEYRYCTRCHARTTWTPDGLHQLKLDNVRHEDRTRTVSDFKRTNPRKYRPRDQEK